MKTKKINFKVCVQCGADLVEISLCNTKATKMGVCLNVDCPNYSLLCVPGKKE